MTNKFTGNPIVTISVKVYQVLLVAYPARFQKEYGLQMVQVFRDCCLRAIRQNGMSGVLKLWLMTLVDLAQSVVTEHTEKETQMKKEMRPEDIRRAGWGLILGAISLVFSILLALTAGEDGSMLALLLLVFVSLPLSVFGILGLRSRYGEKTGNFGKNILLAGAILGPVTSILGFFLLSVDPFWFLPYVGPAVLFACLTAFGLVALQTKPLPRWNILPVLAGFSYPAMISTYIVFSLVSGDWSGTGNIPDSVYITLIIIQGIALLALGTILKSDVPNETPAVA